MVYIAVFGVTAILLLQATGMIPLASVGGPLTIGAVILGIILAVGIHEAWTRRRGPFGWLVNLLVATIGGLLGAQLGGFAAAMSLPYTGSLAAAGGVVFAVALVASVLCAIAGAWAAIELVNRWRQVPGR
ncbi:hypothetical protein [Phreatobacter sp.]|uniref:hypothetical protein n=1 Tax=Phreatobacter sp. TaxID=1966341 RepID=UPI0025E5B021|nr:hypothetical protein [Phreatobacter sp.]